MHLIYKEIIMNLDERIDEIASTLPEWISVDKDFNLAIKQLIEEECEKQKLLTLSSIEKQMSNVEPNFAVNSRVYTELGEAFMSDLRMAIKRSKNRLDKLENK